MWIDNIINTQPKYTEKVLLISVSAFTLVNRLNIVFERGLDNQQDEYILFAETFKMIPNFVHYQPV